MILIPLDAYVMMLLSISLVSTILVISVVRRQISLFKMPVGGYNEQEEQSLRRFRRTLFAFTMTYLVLGIFPMLLNIFTLLYDTGRPPFVPLPSFIFAMCVQAQMLVLSLLLVRLYKLADGEKVVTNRTEKRLESEKISEYKRGQKS